MRQHKLGKDNVEDSCWTQIKYRTELVAQV